jgi:hypothetical protein
MEVRSVFQLLPCQHQIKSGSKGGNAASGLG